MLRIHDDVRDPPSLGRQLAGAWLLCLLITGVTTALTLESGATSPPDAMVAVTYPSHPSEFCRAVPKHAVSQGRRRSLAVVTNRSTPSC